MVGLKNTVHKTSVDTKLLDWKFIENRQEKGASKDSTPVLNHLSEGFPFILRKSGNVTPDQLERQIEVEQRFGQLRAKVCFWWCGMCKTIIDKCDSVEAYMISSKLPNYRWTRKLIRCANAPWTGITN